LKATKPLPRRFDGMIRASGTLDGSGGSIASVGGRHSRMYTLRLAARAARGRTP
jgi:hypothetical protein